MCHPTLSYWPILLVILRNVPPYSVIFHSSVIWNSRVMAWHRQATNHYLNQCWPRSMSPYGFTGPQWVRKLFFASSIYITGRWQLDGEWCCDLLSWRCSLLPHNLRSSDPTRKTTITSLTYRVVWQVWCKHSWVSYLSWCSAGMIITLYSAVPL